MRLGIARPISRRLAPMASSPKRQDVCRHPLMRVHVPAKFAASMVCRIQRKAVGHLCVSLRGRALIAIVISQPLALKVGPPLKDSRDVARRPGNTSVLALPWRISMDSMPQCCRNGLRRAVPFGNARGVDRHGVGREMPHHQLPEQFVAAASSGPAVGPLAPIVGMSVAVRFGRRFRAL